MNLTGKRLLVLGGTRLNCEIIRKAKEMGIIVYVSDYHSDSPGKLLADKSFMVSTKDIDGIVELIRREKIDGVLTGYTDSLLESYVKICGKANLPCYTNLEQTKYSSNKVYFKELCREFDIPVVPDYTLGRLRADEAADYPVLVKPIDNSGGKGIKVCNNFLEVLDGYQWALSHSKKKEVIIEPYLDEKEVTIYYLARQGRIQLSLMADRYTGNRGYNKIPLPLAYLFPSEYLHKYQNELDNRVKKMFSSIGIKNGIIFIQGFIKKKQFLFYEMGYRLTGSMEYKILEKACDINPLELSICHALTNSFGDEDDEEKVNPKLPGIGANITFLSKPGIIGRIDGIDELKNNERIIDIVLSYKNGDIVCKKDVGTLSQIIARIFIYAENRKEILELIKKVKSTFTVSDQENKSILLCAINLADLQKNMLSHVK